MMTLPPARDLDELQRSVSADWMSFDLASVNGNAVRLRVMENATADWHIHANSDELFYVISGTLNMDTEHGTREVPAGHLLVVPAGTRHRARVEARVAMLVVEGIG